MNCQGGIKRLRSATLMTWLGNELITVPNFPAWICDMCGHRHFDNRALAQLSLLLNPEAGTPHSTDHAPQPHPAGQSAADGLRFARLYYRFTGNPHLPDL